ncbi:MAG: hypothetical protein KIT14_14870 [bacterium]|nr:hypothetical protein [bacterium]
MLATIGVAALVVVALGMWPLARATLGRAAETGAELAAAAAVFVVPAAVGAVGAWAVGAPWHDGAGIGFAAGVAVLFVVAARTRGFWEPARAPSPR